MLTKKHLFQILSASLLAAPLSALAAPTYYATVLPAGFAGSRIDKNGEVVGSYNSVAAIWRNGSIFTYSALGGSRFNAISTNCLLTGVSNSKGFIYRNGAKYDIPSPINTFAISPNAINASGDVVGRLERRDSSGPFLYSKGVFKELGNLGGDHGTASGINNAGTVIGFAQVTQPEDGWPTHAFMYRDGVMTDLNQPGWYDSSAYGINQAGDIVGAYAPAADGPLHAFLYSHGVAQDIHTLDSKGSIAYGINNQGQVVGTLSLDDIPYASAFLYENGEMQDLNSIVTGLDGWNLSAAYSINDHGQIVAQACIVGPKCSYVLLDRIKDGAETVAPTRACSGLGRIETETESPDEQPAQ